jgi:hypothetical protein
MTFISGISLAAIGSARRAGGSPACWPHWRCAVLPAAAQNSTWTPGDGDFNNDFYFYSTSTAADASEVVGLRQFFLLEAHQLPQDVCSRSIIFWYMQPLSATHICEAAMAWLKLTAPNGNAVHVSGDQLVRVRIPADGETVPAAKGMVDLVNGQSQATVETPDQVMALIAGATAPLRQAARREK